MPTTRHRRARIVNNRLSAHQRMMFGLGPPWLTPFDTLTDLELREIYADERRELISARDGPLRCEAFWLFEPRIPDELRQPEGEYSDETDWVSAALEEGEQLEQRRRIWLRLHPVQP